MSILMLLVFTEILSNVVLSQDCQVDITLKSIEMQIYSDDISNANTFKCISNTLRILV